MTFEELIQSMGFEDEKEFHRLILAVDKNDPDKLRKFYAWRELDGTKKGFIENVLEKVELK